MIKVILAVLVAFAVTAVPQKKPLAGWVVIIDPGHGGKDPGSNGLFEGKPVYEAAYTYDVALRVQRMVAQEGGLAVLTIIDGRQEKNLPAYEVFPFDRSAVFAIDKKPVVAQTIGLTKRLAYGNMIGRNYPRHKKAWISIHFDKLGKNTEIEGVRIIAPNTELRLAKSLGKSFGDVHRLRASAPIVASGDRDHGLRNLYVLGGRNQTQQKVLIELGNFNNRVDMYRIRAHNIRDAWAAAIVRGLIKY